MSRVPRILLLLVALTAACTSKRAVRSPEELAAGRKALIEQSQAIERRAVDSYFARMSREHDDPSARNSEFFDILVISGGGPYGAFGAGVLRGWKDRPEFDVVTGISVGALMGPYALVNEEPAYERLYEMLRNPAGDWAKKGYFSGLFGASFYKNEGLRKRVRAELDDEFVARMAAAHEDRRVLFVGAANLDLGMMRIFEMGPMAKRNDKQRIEDVLMASAAIPVIYPPVTIDDELYVDGGTVVQMFLPLRARGLRQLLDRWKRRFPDTPFPKLRLWVIVNGQLTAPLGTTQPRWSSIAMRSYSTMSASLLAMTLELFRVAAELADERQPIAVQFRFMAIPADFEMKPLDADIFDEETMRKLADLGRTMAAQGKWRSKVPDPIWPEETEKRLPVGR